MPERVSLRENRWQGEGGERVKPMVNILWEWLIRPLPSPSLVRFVCALMQFHLIGVSCLPFYFCGGRVGEGRERGGHLDLFSVVLLGEVLQVGAPAPFERQHAKPTCGPTRDSGDGIELWSCLRVRDGNTAGAREQAGAGQRRRGTAAPRSEETTGAINTRMSPLCSCLRSMS